MWGWCVINNSQTGAFYAAGAQGHPNSGTPDSSYQNSSIGFNASLSNPTYIDGAELRPKAISVLVLLRL